MTRRELTPADYIAILRRRWLLVAVLAVIGAPLGYGLARILPPQFKSQTVVIVQPPTVSSKLVEPVDTIDLGQRLASLQQQILSSTRLEPIIRKLGLFPQENGQSPMDALVARLQKAIEVSAIQPISGARAQNLPGFTVSVTMDNPRTAQKVCSAITSLFIQESLQFQNQRSAQTTDFLTQQLNDAKTALNAQDAKLAAFKTRYIGSLPDDEQANLNLLNTATTQLDAANQALARAQQDKSFTESMLTQQLAAWQASQSGQNPDTLEQQLAASQTKLANLRARYTDDYPDVIRAKADIAALQKKIAASNKASEAVSPAPSAKATVEPGQITQLRAQIHTDNQTIQQKTKEQEQIKKQIELYQSRVQASPLVEEQYKELTRGYQTALASYNDLLKKKEASVMAGDLTRQQQGEQFSVLDPANLPDQPSFPKPLGFSLGGLGGGLGLGLGLAFLLEMRDTSMHSERDVEFVLQLPVLAMIPAIDPKAQKKAVQTANHTPADSSLRLGARA